jgi:tetratricopeptide (TPR) repeat protein
MNRPAVRIVFALFFALAAANNLFSDTVKLHGKPAFRNVRIRGFKHGRLVFLGVSRQTLRKPLEQVHWFEITHRDALNHAERAAAQGRWQEAARAYLEAQSDIPETWLGELLRRRLLRAYNGAGRFPEAVALFAELVQRDPRLPERYAPNHPAAPGSNANSQARERLSAAIETCRSTVAKQRLRVLHLELLLYDEVQPLPAEFAVALDSTIATSTSSAPAAAPAAGLPGLLAQAPTSRPTPPRLSASSFVLLAARSAFERQDFRRAAALLERTPAFLEPAEATPWRLLRGRCRIEVGDHAAAADDLLRLAEEQPDPSSSASALYYVGLAHERMGRGDVAKGIYSELLQRDDTPADVRADCRMGLRRIGE